MSKVYSWLLLVALLFTGSISIAQNNVLAGKITDENNNPVSYAVVKLTYGDRVTAYETDADGLYYTAVLQPGQYKLAIVCNGKEHKVKSVTIVSDSRKKQFYNFSFGGKKVITTVTNENPFLATRLKAIEKRDPRREIFYGDDTRLMRFNVDSKPGVLVPADCSTVKIPAMK